MRHWARFLTAKPLACGIIALLLTSVAVLGLPRLGFDIRPNSTTASQNQASTDLENLKANFGADDNDIVLIASGDDLLSWPHLQAYRQLRDQIRAIEDVQHVGSVFDIRRRGKLAPLIPTLAGKGFDPAKLRDQLLRHPIAANQCISGDGKLLVMWARIKGDSLTVSTISSAIDSTREFANQYEKETGATVQLAGHTAVRADVLMQLQRAMFISCTAASVICFIVSLLLFRSIVPVLVAVIPPAVGCVWTFGLMAWCGEPIGGLTTALPNLMFAIGLTDSVHLLLDGQRYLCRGRSRRHAAYAMLIRIGPACLLTALTTMIGFGSLLLSSTDSVKTFGFWAAIGTTFVVVADLVLLPLLLRWIPAQRLAREYPEHDKFAVAINALISPTIAKAGLTTVCAVVVCAALCIPAFSQSPDIVWTETIPDDAPATRAMQFADKQLDGVLLAYVMIQWPEQLEYPDNQIVQVTSATQNALRKQPGFGADFSINNVLAAGSGRKLADRYRNFLRAPDSVRSSLLNTDERSLVVSARVANDGAAALNGRVDLLENELDTIREQFPDYKLTVTGTVVAASRNMHEIILDLARSLTIASVLVFFVFTFAFRCLKTGLLSVIPNAFPLLVAAAILSLMGYPLQITTALTFSLCLGLAVDDTMHVLIRYRDIRRHGTASIAAVHKTIRHVGPALIVTTAILLSGFASMLTSPLPGVRMFAALSALTLITALVGDLLILPAMLVFISGDQRAKHLTKNSSEQTN